MSTNQSAIEARRPIAPAFSSGGLWLGLVAIGLVAFFWPGLRSLPGAWERPEYSHGYLIPLIALYMFLAQLARDPERTRPDDGSLLGMIAVGFGLVVGLLGNLVNIADVTTYGFIIAISGVVLVAMGTRRGLRYWAPVFFLVFMLPLPNFIYWPLSIRLQLISSELGVGLISLLGIPVLLDGNIIDLGVYKLQVAEACSGLRYLFPLASFGFLFAALYKGPAWHRVVLFLSTLPITVAMNSVRIAVVGILVDRYGIEQAEGFLHVFEGWIIFIACLVVLYLEAMILQRFVRSPQPIRNMLDVDVGGLRRAAGRILGHHPSSATMATAIVICLAAAAWYLAPDRVASEPQRDPLVLFPLEIAEWQGTRGLLDASIEQVLAADDYLVADFNAAGAAAGVNLFVAYYHSQTEGAGIHSPEVCLPVGGVEVSRWTTHDTGVQTSSGSLAVNRAIIQKGLDRQLVYYWFEQRGRRLTSDYATKAYTLVDSLTRGRTDGALVRVVTPIAPDQPLAVADARLTKFLEATLPSLPRYLPE